MKFKILNKNTIYRFLKFLWDRVRKTISKFFLYSKLYHMNSLYEYGYWCLNYARYVLFLKFYILHL